MLMNLILGELLVSLYGIPVDFLASWQGGWKMGSALCQATGFILTSLGMMRIMRLLVCPPYFPHHRNEQYKQPHNLVTLQMVDSKTRGKKANIHIHQIYLYLFLGSNVGFLQENDNCCSCQHFLDLECPFSTSSAPRLGKIYSRIEWDEVKSYE